MYVYIVLFMVFNYGVGYMVDEVSESDYKSCMLGNLIFFDSSGIMSMVFKMVGLYYFICVIFGYCVGGMKFFVNVGVVVFLDGGGDIGDGIIFKIMFFLIVEGSKVVFFVFVIVMLKLFKVLVVICVVVLLYVLVFF